MKNRILKNWTIKRVIFIGVGIFMIVNSIIHQHWFAILFGIYFASIGLFDFGCASGNCYSGKCDINVDKQKNT